MGIINDSLVIFGIPEATSAIITDVIAQIVSFFAGMSEMLSEMFAAM
ncbi:MAG: hypothetical protein LBB67_04300 [Oscillospiraceae bacterium]|jgi:hypothetical protein|nr:hypothetical protein [Oscillospiraceae bacterium]